MSTPWPYPLWIAHRGAGKLAPENTLAAFRLGAQHGYRAYECDVKLSSDGVAFLLHDATLERTTSGHGSVADHDWSALSRLDAGSWHSAAYAGEPPPSLEAIASHVLHNGHALNIEIKPVPGTDDATGAAVAAAAARLWAGSAAPPLLSSFNDAALAAAARAAHHLPRALLLDAMQAGWLERAQALGCVAVVAQHRLWTAASIEQVHGAGMRALAYTVNDAVEAERLLALHINGLITDAVNMLPMDEGL